MKMPVVTRETALKARDEMMEPGFSEKIMKEMEEENPCVYASIKNYAERYPEFAKQIATCGVSVYLLFKHQLELNDANKVSP